MPLEKRRVVDDFDEETIRYGRDDGVHWSLLPAVSPAKSNSDGSGQEVRLQMFG